MGRSPNCYDLRQGEQKLGELNQGQDSAKYYLGRAVKKAEKSTNSDLKHEQHQTKSSVYDRLRMYVMIALL